MDFSAVEREAEGLLGGLLSFQRVPGCRRLRVYADTSVIGCREDEKFREHSHRLIERCVWGGVTLVISSVVVNELKRAPQAVQDVLVVLGTDHVEVIPIAEKVRELADCYVESGALGEGMRADAPHIAAATVAGVDVLASWNFRHIVNLW